jgi:stage V sporulation protein R
MKTHSDVVSPYAGDQQVALKLNPYHVGYVMWEKIIKEQGVEAARRIMEQEDDFGFIRNHLSQELADDMNLFSFNAKRNGEIKVSENSLDALHENILAPKFNFGAPRVVVDELKKDGSLILRHESGIDGRGLEIERARKVLHYIALVWKRPVKLLTLDAQDQEVWISSETEAA